MNDSYTFPDLESFQPFGNVFYWIPVGSSSLLSIRLKSRITKIDRSYRSSKFA